MTLRILARLLILLAAVATLSCSKRDPVLQLIDDAVEAAEDRDADALAELLAQDFAAGDGSDRDSTVRYAKQMLFAYRALDLDVSDLNLNRRGDSARATFRVKLMGVPNQFGGIGDLVPRAATYDFDISARDAGGDWVFVSATWTEVSP